MLMVTEYSLLIHQNQQKKAGTTPCHVWGHTLKVLEIPSSSFSQVSNGDLDQQSPRSLDMWIELDAFDSTNWLKQYQLC